MTLAAKGEGSGKHKGRWVKAKVGAKPEAISSGCSRFL